MSINPRIIGSFNVGGGFTFHTDYRIEVSKDGQTWNVYRRFSAFETLHKSIIAALGGEERVKSMGIVFPDKSFSGSVGSTSKGIVEHRIHGLQNYLNTILALERMNENPAILLFFDCDNRGTSGVQVQLGTSKISKETFAKVKFLKHPYERYINFWSTCYVVALKNGSIAVMASMYDNLSKAICNMSVGSGQATVVPKANRNIIELTSRSSGHQLLISFSTQQEAAFWIRTISDFSVNTNADSDAKADIAEKRKSATEAAKAAAARPTEPVKNIRAQGTGNTEDELSAMIGI